MGITISIEGEDFYFENVDGLLQWIDDEVQFWNWLEKVSPEYELQFLFSLPNKYWNRARQLIQQYKKDSEDAKEKVLQEILATIRNIYGLHYAILSTSPRAQFIETLRHKDPTEAAFALSSFIKRHEFPLKLIPYATRGIVRTCLFDLGISADAALAEKQALQSLSKRWSSIIETSDKRQSEFTRMIDDAAAKSEKLLGDELAQCGRTRRKASDQFEELEHIFREKLALLAPVTYWKEKATKHRNVSVVLGIAFVVMGGITAWLVWLTLQHFVIGQVPVSSNLSDSIIQPEYWRYTIPFAIGTFLVWPMRILARMLLSNLHLHEDAIERVTMANTYLALTEAKAGLKEEDRKLITDTGNAFQTFKHWHCI